jgi:hypothetical protein
MAKVEKAGLTLINSAAGMSAIGKPTESGSSAFGSRGDDQIQSLKVWEPPAFCMAFFWYVCFSLPDSALPRGSDQQNNETLIPSAIPPTAPILTYILTPLHPLLTPLIHLSTTFLLSHLATSYQQLVKDRMFLSAEVMREYDHRFVYRKVFASKVDRGVMTNEGELAVVCVRAEGKADE